MTTHSKKQLLQVGGALSGWLLAQIYDKKDSVPFTLLGGCMGFIMGAELLPEKKLSGSPKPHKRSRKRA